MKYALWIVADQTWSYYTSDGCITTVHAEAALFDSRAEAESFATQEGRRLKVDAWIEEVYDVTEFQAREDTW